MANNNKKTTSVRMAPHNLEAEQSVLGCILLSGDVASVALGKLEEKDFYSEIHQKIFGAMRKIYDRREPVDFVTLTDELDAQDELQNVGGTTYLTTLTNIVPSAASYMTYLQIVKKNALLRSLIQISENIINKSYEGDEQEAINFAQSQIFSLAENGQTSDLEQINYSIDEVLGKFEAIQKDPTCLQGLPTGFYGIDDVTNGLQKSNLIYLAARPGIGKTSLAMNIATYAAINKGAKIAVFALEMSKAELVQRMICSISGVQMHKALKGELTSSEWTKIYNATKKLRKAQIYIDDSSLNKPGEILQKCRKLKREHGLDLIVVDHLQLMKDDVAFKGDNRQQEITEISRKLKVLAKEVEVPVLVLSQMSRDSEKRKNHRPVLSDLRESGAIEQDADIVMFIHKKDMYEQAEGKPVNTDVMPVELIFAKNRSGQIKDVPLIWNGPTVSFLNKTKDADIQSAINSAPVPPANPEPIPEEIENEIKNIFGDEEE